MPTGEDLALLPGVPESRLPREVVEQLDLEVRPPPWSCRFEAVLWMHRATPSAASALPAVLRSRAGVPITLGAFIHYLRTPVGPYSEVAAMPRLFPGRAVRGHIPFIAVDSVPSLCGGRAHWALPKMLARFSSGSSTGEPLEGRGAGWWMRAAASPRGPSFPLKLSLHGVQLRSSQTPVAFRSALRGRARLAIVDVDVDPACSMASWLRAGRHLGVVVTSGRMRLGPPRPKRRRARG